MSSAFKAARDSAYSYSWAVNKEYTADKELDDFSSLVELRKRSKQLIKDSLIAAGIQQAILNVVGTLTFVKVEGKTKKQTSEAQKVIDDFVENATFDNKTLNQVLEELTGASIADGDILINTPLDKTRKGVQTVVELIEASRVKTPYDLRKDDHIRHGVQYDREGRIVKYYAKKYYKTDSYSDNKDNFLVLKRRTSVNNFERQVTDLFKSPLNSRPQMSRQYPLLTPVMSTIKYLEDYIEAVIVGARVAACFAGFITTDNPAGAWNAATTDSNGNVIDPQDDEETRRVHKLQPGLLSYLKPGQKIEFASPNRPNDNVDAFILRMLKQIAMYLRIPYPILCLDLVDVNYSSWRGGANEMRRFVNRWRRALERELNWILKTVLYEGVVRQLISGKYEDLTIKLRWQANNILDPEKEARANALELKNGTTSPQRICAEEGKSYEEVQQELLENQLQDVERQAQVLLRQKELAEKYDIEFTPAKDDSSKPGGDKPDEEDKKERRKQDGNW